MRCANCGQDSDESAAYCYQCGNPLSAASSIPSAISPSLSETPEGAWGRPPGPARVPWGITQVIWGIGLVFLVFLVISIAVFLLDLGEIITSVALLSSLGTHVLGVAIILVIWKFGFDSKGFSPAALGLVKPKLSWGVSGGLAILVLIASLVFTASYAWLGDYVGLSEVLLPPEIPQDILFTGVAGIFNYEGIAVWTPITEELLFRGFIFAGLATRMKPSWAILISGGVFSLFHILPGVLIPIFVTGILLAWLYHRTGSLWPSIAAHAGQNAVAITVTMLGLQTGA